ncbi:uncharacterized protein LOC143290338 [Babylonia areolata]|uniref:uncharacterized protein LOC143290338 n=1 Tax=Babylonia areolata TaxID=304850 RepID=UPI003FD36F1E
MFCIIRHVRYVQLGRRYFTSSMCSLQKDVGGPAYASGPSLQSRCKEADDTQEAEKNSKKHQKEMAFAEVINVKKSSLRLTRDSTPVCATVIHPGLLPDNFGDVAHPSLVGILRTASFARIYAMHVPMNEEGQTFLEYNHMTSGSYTFIASTQVDIFPGMYDSAVPKWPLEVKMEGGHIGRTSLSTVSTMTTCTQPDPQTLMTQVTQVVLVDKVTRRPTPIKDKWRDKYQAQCVRGQPLVIRRQDVPSSGPLSVYQVKIAWSDTDMYRHTNYSNYVRFAVDAVHDALHLGRLDGALTEKDVRAGVRQLRVVYLGESVEGDVLRVQVWRGDGDRCVVCSMEKEGQVINQVTLSYFPAAC